MLRTHTCGELTLDNISAEVILCGWVDSRRDHGEIIFMDLRDRYGVTQIVFDPAKNKNTHEKAHTLRNEYCVKIKGIVAARPEGTVNAKLKTGGIEVEVKYIDILSTSENTPFEITDDINVYEDIRLKYRYLDLRRGTMQNKLRIRHKTCKFINDFLDNEGFTLVETPMLTKSTPEGARDYLIPSRIQQGSFYALPQSPQIFKQLLMVGGVDRYFQIVRCFRDEDLRADRQPEFTQLDMEMSFVEQEDILDICERLFQGFFREIAGKDIKVPLPRIKHEEAMSKYGSDKPDTRFDVLLEDFTEDVKTGCEFKIFNNAVKAGGSIVALAAPGYGALSRKEINDLTLFVGKYGAKGLAFFKVEESGTLTSPITKFFSKGTLDLFRERTGAVPGDMIFMVADSTDTARAAMGALRLKIGKEKGLVDRERFDLLWVVDFPLFKFSPDENKWVSEHHPFTSFRKEDILYLENGELSKVRSLSYDLVLNGSEIGSGSIRIHEKDIQKKIFDILGITEDECRQKFGFLLEAFKYGPPPHGGVAFGLDRLITLLTGDASIREVIPFPKTQKGICPLTEAPSPVEDDKLQELGIRPIKRKEA